MSIADLVQSVALLVALAALWWQIRESNKLAKLENFRCYTERFQSIFEHLPSNVESGEIVLKKMGDAEREPLLRWIRAYFDLCSEEFYLKNSKFLDKKVWKLWDGGMRDTINKPLFLEAWPILQRDGYYADDFANHVVSIQAECSDA